MRESKCLSGNGVTEKREGVSGVFVSEEEKKEKREVRRKRKKD